MATLARADHTISLRPLTTEPNRLGTAMLTAVRMCSMDQRPGARLWLLQRPRLQQRLDDDVHRQG